MTACATPVPAWSRPLRRIHLLLAIAVTTQLFLGSFMRSPHPGQPDSAGFVAHEIVGASVFVLVILHWIWSCSHPDEGLRHLFPWTRVGVRHVFADARNAVVDLRLPSGGPERGDGGLAGLVHGLGLLAVTATVLVGSAFFASRIAGAARGRLELIKDVHDVLTLVVWIYWGGHLAITLLHGALHRPVWKRMFSF